MDVIAAIDTMIETEQLEGQITMDEMVKEISIDEVRKVLAEKSRLGHTEKVRDLLAKYGVKRLSDVDPSKYADLLEDGRKL